MNIIVRVPRNSHSPKRAGSKKTSGPSRPPSPSPPGPPPPGPPRSRAGRGDFRRTSVLMPARSLRGLQLLLGRRQRLGLHHVVLREVRVGVLVRPAVHLRDRARPVSMRRGRGRRPLEAVGVPRVLARLPAGERAPEEVYEEEDLRDAEDK